MDLLSQEREKYADMWALDVYGQNSPGERYAPIFQSMTDPNATVLDAGCGCAKGGLALSRLGYDVTLSDLTSAGVNEDARHLPFREACLWDDLLRAWPGTVKFDYVYCCDLMEHIPIAFTMLVAVRLLDIARRGVFFAINLQPDVWGHLIGRPLHETVMPFVWWRDHLAAVGELVEARDLLSDGAFLVRPR